MTTITDRRLADRRHNTRGGRRSQDATPAELDRFARRYAALGRLSEPVPDALVSDVLSASMNRVGALEIEEHYDERFRDEGPIWD